MKAFVSVIFTPPNITKRRKLKTDISTDKLELTKSFDRTNVKSKKSLFNIIKIKDPIEVKSPKTPKTPNPGIIKTSIVIRIIPIKNNTISQFSATPFR